MTPERRIRTLRLAAPEESWIARGAFLVEDALRTASLPWADAGRLLLVRTVDLGTIPAGAAPASVALALESRLRELTPAAVHAAKPDAPRAAAVWFRDAAEAHALLAAKLATSEEPTAWFWPLAVPAWKPDTPRSAALRTILFGALETPAGPAAALEVVRALREAGGLDFLASALAPADGPFLLRACGWRVPDGTGAALPAVRGTAALVLARWAEGWGRGDGRTVWLGAVLRAVEPSSPAPLPRAGEGRTAKAPVVGERMRGREEMRWGLGSPPQALECRPFGALPLDDGATRPDGTESSPKRSRSVGGEPPTGAGILKPGVGTPDFFTPAPPATEATIQPVAWKDLETPSVVDLPSSLRPVGSEPPPPEKDLAPDLDPPPALEEPAPRAFSPHAGLFFLLPVLARLGMATFLEENPSLLEIHFPARLLDLVARRLGAAADGPIRRALPLPEDAEREEDEALRILLNTWLSSVRRWCRLRAGIGLADLVRRPGQVIATCTHIDVFFDPCSVEMRVRRAGLDLDPGWVPWLGRVVLFHYEQPPEVLDVG